LPFKEVSVRREGIRLHIIFYYGDVLTSWLGVEKRHLRAKYDPRDLSTVFLEDEDGRHWPIRYRDLARPRITLWEHKRAVRDLRERGRSLVDEQSIFEAAAARRVVTQAAIKTKAARRDLERIQHLRDREGVSSRNDLIQDPPGEQPTDDVAKVPMPTDANRGSVEDWL
jgi:putative transposase